MGLIETVRSALGLRRPLVVLPADAPMTIGPAGRQALAVRDAGTGIHVRTVEVSGGHAVHVTEGPLQGPPPPELAPLPVTAADSDLERLRGRTLDHQDGRWLVRFSLEVRARETPNPNGRLYLTNRQLADGGTVFRLAMQDAPDDIASKLARLPGVESALVRDHTATLVRREDASWDQLDRAVDQTLREHFLLLGRPVLAARPSGHASDLEGRVQAVLESDVLPLIHRDGGDLTLLGIEGGEVQVSMGGACRGCPASSATLRNTVERVLLERFPDEVAGVTAV